MPLKTFGCAAVAIFLLVACDGRDGALDDGLAAYRAGDYETAVRYFDGAIAANPKSADAYLWRGHARAHMGKRTQAAEDYTRAQVLRPGGPEPTYALGYLRAEEGRPEEAIRLFTMAIAADSTHLPSYIERSKLLAKRGQNDDALRDITIVLSRMQSESQLFRARARIHKSMGKFEDAKADFDRAVDLKPTDPNLLTERAELHYAAGEYQSALEDLERAVNVAGGAAYPYNNLAWFLVTNPKRQLRNGRRALGLVEHALSKREGEPDDAAYVASIGTRAAVSAELGDFKSAKEAQEKCISLAEQLALGDLDRQRQYLKAFEKQRALVLDRDQTLLDAPG